MLVAVIWGANFVVIDLGLGDLPPTLFVALRFVVVLLPAIFLVPRPQVPWRDVVLVGLFMSLGQFALLYTALAVGMPAGLASLVLQAQVGLTVVIAALALRERPSRPQVAGVVVGAVGLGVVAVGRAVTTPAARPGARRRGRHLVGGRQRRGAPRVGPHPVDPRGWCGRPTARWVRRRPVDDGVVGARRPAAAAGARRWRSTARMPWPTP